MKKIDVTIPAGEIVQVNIHVPGEDGKPPQRIAYLRFDFEIVRVKLLDDGYISVNPTSNRDVSLHFEP